jgi:hypothetical protein
MNIEWPMVTALVAVVGAAASIVTYVIRKETQAIRDLVILDRETVKLRLGKVEDSLVKVETAILAISDFKWQLRITEERIMALSNRLDELSKRHDHFSDAAHDRLEDTRGG